eukprot:UN08399
MTYSIKRENIILVADLVRLLLLMVLFLKIVLLLLWMVYLYCHVCGYYCCY